MTDDRVYLEYILFCIDKIGEYSQDRKKKFLDYSLIQDAILRRLQTLAETTQRLSRETKDRIPDVDWKNISGFRNILVHDYLGGIDLEIVWNVIENYLPDLETGVRRVLDESES